MHNKSSWKRQPGQTYLLQRIEEEGRVVDANTAVVGEYRVSTGRIETKKICAAIMRAIRTTYERKSFQRTYL